MIFEDFSKKYAIHLLKERKEALKYVSMLLSSDDISEREMALGLKICLPYISYFNKNIDKELLQKCGLTKLTFKYFHTYDSLCLELNPLFKNCEYKIEYEQLFTIYENYISDFYFSLFNLESEIGFDPSLVLKNLSRQYREGRWDKELNENDKKEILETIQLFRRKFSSLDYSFKNNDIIPNLKRLIKFPHKVWFNILYKEILALNEGVNESDFKVFYFDLIKILICDKSILKDDYDSKVNYVTIRRFKIKRVERLILS